MTEWFVGLTSSTFPETEPEAPLNLNDINQGMAAAISKQTRVPPIDKTPIIL